MYVTGHLYEDNIGMAQVTGNDCWTKL